MFPRLSRILIRSALTAAAIGMAAVGPTAADVAEHGPVVASADSFVEAIGVDSHFNYSNTPYVLQWPAISVALIDSGIRHIRDGGKPTRAYVARLATLGARGIRHGAGVHIDGTPQDIATSLAAYAPYVDNVEPANEYDTERKKDPDWAARLVANQKMLYSAVRSDPANSSIAVLGPPLAHTALYAELGALDDYEDAGNLHTSTCDLNPGTADPRRGNIANTHALLRMSTVHKPIWTTETGYNDDMVRPCALADETIAKYDPRTVAEKWNAGEARIIFYQLADMPTDAVFGGMGLIRADGTPKPQFTALASMIHVLADPGAPFAPKPLDYTLGGDTRNVHRTLLQKRDGRYDLLLWLEVSSWDPKSRTPFTVQPQTVTLSLPRAFNSGKIYSYTRSFALEATPLQFVRGTTNVRVGDSISIVELTP